MPADVQIGPSAMKIRSTSTVTLGYRRRSSSANIQWVVTRRPSSNPASPRMKAAMQIDATRRVFVGAPRRKESNCCDGGHTSGGEPTNSVSNAESATHSVSTSMPNELARRPPATDVTWTS